MKYLKKFHQVFESGIPSRETKELEIAIKNIISSLNYKPHIRNTKGLYPDSIRKAYNTPEEGVREFSIGVSGNQSKYGLVIEVSFLLDYPVGYGEINAEFKQGTLVLEISDVISQMMNKSVTLYGFDFFGSKVMGQKDGRTLEVEDVLPKFDEVVEQLDSTDNISDRTWVFKNNTIVFNNQPIKFWLLVK